MTKEELKELKEYYEEEVQNFEQLPGYERDESSTEAYERHKLILELIEQQPILDKIKAEILKEVLAHSGTGEETMQAYADGLKKAAKIINKCKVEKEK